MKQLYILLVIALSATTPLISAVTIGFSPLDSSIANIGIFDNNTNVDIYLMSGGNGPSGAFALLPDRIDLGTYQFNSSLTVAPFEFNLGDLQPLLSNGVDEYLSMVLLGGTTTVVISRLESVWFGTATDLIGLDIPNPTFAINELRSDIFGTGLNEKLRVYYLDLGVTIVPEPATWGLLIGSLALALTMTQRKRRQ